MVDNEIINDIKNNIGVVRTQKAEKIYALKQVKIESIDLNWDYTIITICAIVAETSTKKFKLHIRVDLPDGGYIYGHNCTCSPYAYKICEHTLAVLLEFNNNPKYFEKINDEIDKEKKFQEKRMFNNIIQKFEQDDEDLILDKDEQHLTSLNTNINIVPVLKKSKNSEYNLNFKIGEDKLYNIKSLDQFYKNYIDGAVFKYGNNLVFKHEESSFTKSSKEFLQLILKYGQAIYYGNSVLETKSQYVSSKIPSSSLLLRDQVIEDIFQILKNNPYTIELDGKKTVLNFLKPKDNSIEFKLEETEKDTYKLSLNKERSIILEGINTIYEIDSNNVYEYDKNKNKDVFKLVSMFEDREKNEFNFEKSELIGFVNNVLPKIRDNVSLSDLNEDIRKKYIPKKLGVKVYLDLTRNGDVIATVKYCYDNIEFEAFSNNKPNIPRDLLAEKEVQTRFNLDGFQYSSNYESYILKDEEKIYNFITNSINYYMEKYEVLISEEFKKREVRQPKISSLGVKIQNDLLNIDLSGLEFDPSELKKILQKYKLKKKYHRLKNGEFLSLEQNSDLDFMDNLTEGLDIDYSSLSKGRLKIPVNRSLYLNKLLENMQNVDIKEDKNFKDIILSTENGKIDEEIEIPKELDATLRIYQKTGYKWLRILDKYKFGGILADDMGLRKNFASNCCNT